MNRKSFVLCIFLLLCSLHGQVFAYLDPGTGSLLIQGIIAGLVAAAVVGRMYLSIIVGWFKGLWNKSEEAKFVEDEEHVSSKDDI